LGIIAKGRHGMKKFAFFLLVFALLIIPSCFGFLGSIKESLEPINSPEDAEKICSEVCKDYGGWMSYYNTSTEYDCSCVCATSRKNPNN